MTPAFRITHEDADITAAIAARLLSLRVTDQAGIVADQFDVAVDNRDGAIVIPETGAELAIAMGYVGQPLQDLGRYTIDEIEVSGLPRTISLHGKSANFKASLKSQKHRAWDRTTLGAIVQTIAKEHGMEAQVDERYAGIRILHIDQAYESDLNLLTRLSDQYGGVAKPAGGALLFVRRADGRAADGKPLSTLALVPSDTTGGDGWRTSVHERLYYARVGAFWGNRRKAETEYVYAGEGEPVFYIRHPFRGKQAALAGAESKLRQLRAGTTGLTMSLVGKPELCAEMPISLAGFDSLTDGEWIVTRAEHVLSGQGLTTRIEAQRRADLEAEDEAKAVSDDEPEEGGGKDKKKKTKLVDRWSEWDSPLPSEK